MVWLLLLQRGRGMGGGGGVASGRDAKAAVVELLLQLMVVVAGVAEGAPTWCIARSGASQGALQTALDYACGAGADCTPIQASGLCYLPNTVQAHASYAFNSYYQRSNGAPGSCDFAGTATVTVTDPSFGSCTYPSSASAAGGATPTTPPGTGTGTGTPTTTNLPPTTPTTTTTPGMGGVGGGGLTPGFGPATPDTSFAAARSRTRLPRWAVPLCYYVVVGGGGVLV